MGSHPKNVESSIKNKFKALFTKINEENYVMDTYYSDNLINKIVETRKDNNYICCISDLLIEPIQNLENYHVSVQVFLIRLLAFCVSKELYFTKIMCKKSNSLSRAYSELGSPSMIPSMRVAYLEVALSLVDHHTGLHWLLDSGMWKEILSANNESKTVFVTRQKYKFVSKLLWRINDLEDEANVKLVLTYILKPLIETEIVVSKSITAEEEEQASKQFEPMLHMLQSIMSEYARLTKSSLVLNTLLNHFKVVTHMYMYMDRFRKDSLTSLLAKLCFRIILAKTFHYKPITDDTVHTAEDFIETSVAYFNTVQLFITRRNALSVLDYCYSCNEIWNGIWRNKKPKISTVDGKEVNLQNKMLFLCLVPSIAFIKRNVNMKCPGQADVGGEYIMKLIHASCDHTAKSAKSLAELTLETDTETIVLQSVKRLSSLKNSMNNEQANLVFQGLFYVMRQFDPNMEDNDNARFEPSEATFQEDQENLFVYSYVLETILLLVKNYDINWQESLEVICLYNLVYNILKKPNLTTKFIVTALNVITETVKKFLPPNLSLLMESKPGSAIHELGRLVYMRMHDLHWEVRDSALELLLVCTEISYIKFPPFQKQIMENDLIVVATALALNDHEFYARASALRCLGAACKVNNIWEGLKLKHPHIQESLLGILRNNQEGIVRKEAARVLCELYLNFKLAPSFKRQLYEQMVHSAIGDFHWEVQLVALKFWKIVMQSHLTEQGMLDGTFPPVTFSKESRKIVTLNKAEIQRRLSRSLDELASVGCLTVLTVLLHEDTDVEIMQVALCISSELLDILKRYDVPERLQPAEGEPRTVQEFRDNMVKQENMEDDDVIIETEENQSDSVIESIINADDMNLLAHIYERRMRLQSDKPEPAPEPAPAPRLLHYVRPYIFVSHLMSKDFKAVIEYKKQWRDGIRSVESLLDDVLGIYEIDDEINNLDCY